MASTIASPKLLMLLAASAAGFAPIKVYAQAEPTYPKLTKADISVCRSEFAVVQQDVVQHYRVEANAYRSGGTYYHVGQDSSSNVQFDNQAANKYASIDPVSFYYEGMTDGGMGQGVGGIPTMNGFDGADAHAIYLRDLNQQTDQDGSDALLFSLYRAQTRAEADRCVARVYFNKFFDVNPRLASSSSERDNPALTHPMASSAVPGSENTDQNDENVWGTCINSEDPVRSGIQMIFALRNRCNKTVTISFCMKATYEAAGDWNLCSKSSYKTYDIAAGTRFEFPFTPVEPGGAMSDGRIVDHQEISASGAACVGSSPSVYVSNGSLVFQHC